MEIQIAYKFSMKNCGLQVRVSKLTVCLIDVLLLIIVKLIQFLITKQKTQEKQLTFELQTNISEL